MPTYNYPGVYIEEKPSGPGPIRGVSPSAMGLIGWTDKGPVDYPTLVTSFVEFADKFGSFTAMGLAPTMAYAFFANGGGELYMVRVTHEDAVESWVDLTYEISALTPEFISDTVEASGLYTGTLDHSPILPTTVTITFQGTPVVFTDDGLGGLVGVGGGGGTGSIDYNTGDFSIQLNVPGNYTGAPNDILAVYEYRVFRFEMTWPGVLGDFYRVVISGAPDYLDSATASYTRFNVVVEQDINEDPTAPAWNTVETFEALVFNDVNDPNYVATVMNDVVYGSKVVRVIDYGNAMSPADLEGVHIGGAVYPVESFSATQEHSDGSSAVVPDLYDGAWKGWSYSVNAPGALEGVFPTTFYPQFWFVENGLRIGTGAVGPLPVPILTWTPAAINPVPAFPTITCDLTIGLPGFVLTTNALGQILHGVTVVGSINYATGVIAIDLTPAGDTFIANSPILLDCYYAEPVTLNDDGNGNLFLCDPADAPGGPYTATPTKFSLDSAGTNEVDYETGNFTVTWKVAGNPAAGPAGFAAVPPIGGATETADYYTQPDTQLVFVMANGADGSAIDSGDLVDPALSADGRGLWAFGKADAIMNLVAADFQTDTYVDDALLTYAELMKDKFVIMTYPHGFEPQEAVNWKKFQLAKFSSRGALYGPHIKIKDPVTDAALDVPCGGHVAGVYARTDSIRNVGEAPAGMTKGVLNWLLGLEQSLDRANVGILTDANINALVDWPQTGRCVWGARSIAAAGSEWGYLQARRLFMFVEKSVFNATHIHVFENNGPALWSRIRLQVINFLKTLYDQQYFAGSSPDDAFFVICDSSNNPQNTVDMGIVFCDVGIAPNKPGEFIVFRFQQKAL